jgi:hypothetical protein
MDEPRGKDPERVQTGRLGALVLHASGKTDTRAARAEWERRLALEFGIGDELTAEKRARRMRSAMRARMTRLARQRWASRSGGHDEQP